MRKIPSTLNYLQLPFFSCKKENPQSSIVGQWIWIIQYANNPAYNSTPQSTGINETISFNANGNYLLVQHGITVNSGTYQRSVALNTLGHVIPAVLYTNSRVTDSAGYFRLYDNGDTLVFSPDFFGTVGSGARHYGRQK